MIVINQSNQSIIHQLGGFQCKTKTKKYRKNQYCIETEVEEGILIHNFFTGASVMIRPFEYMNIYTNDPCDYAEFLTKNYFIVPEDFNEKELVDLLRERTHIPITSNYLEHPRKFVILSTTRCNARCFYCYEMQAKGKTHMSYETAEKVAKYIMEVAPKNTPLNISWFGGEPLYNMDVIDIISSRLNSAGINFRSTMISNSYLFDEDSVKRAITDWRLTNIQITLDGTEKVYNDVKNYIYKDTNPYQKVLDNIELLLRNDIAVSIRMNCDTHNQENLKDLIIELDQRFGSYGNFSMYIWPLFEEGFTRTPEQRESLYNAILELEELLLSLEYPCGHDISQEIKGIHCMVDSGDSITISPKGEVGLCEHYIDSGFIGHIDIPYERDMDIIKSWRNYTERTELCQDCPLYPQCLKMQKCPDEMACDEHQKNYWIEHYKLAIRGRWIMHKSNKNKEKEDNKCNNCKDPKNNN